MTNVSAINKALTPCTSRSCADEINGAKIIDVQKQQQYSADLSGRALFSLMPVQSDTHKAAEEQQLPSDRFQSICCLMNDTCVMIGPHACESHHCYRCMVRAEVRAAEESGISLQMSCQQHLPAENWCS